MSKAVLIANLSTLCSQIFCAEMLDANCVGLYVPGKRTFIPNDNWLREYLQSVAESRLFGVM